MRLTYELIDLQTDEPMGEFETVPDARRQIRRSKLTHYAIYRNDDRGSVLVEKCDPYEGDDDRVKIALGQSCASEQITN